MKKTEFDLLLYMSEHETLDREEAARLLFRTEEKIADEFDALSAEGFLSASGITARGWEYLEQHRVDNAIILAAGMSSRFVPLNFEKPKGLLKVNGEVLIERQIRQLRERGIQEIVVVVGHMWEAFSYLTEKYGVSLVVTDDYVMKNNHASVYAARAYLKNTIVTSSDLYFSENVFQSYAYDAYYCTVYVSGKTPERGVETDEDDCIFATMYGDRCHDIWVTLGYAFFSERFSKNYLTIMEREFDLPQTAGKFWADIQDEHLKELFMYAKRVDSALIHEFDTLEELREFDPKYVYDSGSTILQKLCKMLAVHENNIVGIEPMRKLGASMFAFRCKGDSYICDVAPGTEEKISWQGRVYYQCSDLETNVLRLYKMDKNIRVRGVAQVDVAKELDKLYGMTEDFESYHRRALPLCAAENIISPFARLPLSCEFQERYIMNNTYSFNMDDNFIGCEKLFPFYQQLSDVCERVFGAKYSDARPFSGMHCIDMVVKTICTPGEKMMILGKAYGGHASVQPVVERLGIETVEAPYNMEENDLDYAAANQMICQQRIKYVLLAPSDLIKPLDVEKLDTSDCVLLWDCSQLMGLIAAGLAPNPLKTKRNVIMFGGTHKTLPGPASGLILTNEKTLHDKMELAINPKYLRNSQMHQKICLLFTLLEFEQYGAAYMSHMLHCSNYLGRRLREHGYDVADVHGRISETHQVFIRCSREEMDTIYDNAYQCEVTLNKKQKELFLGHGIRLGTQEIARYDWNDKALDTVAQVVAWLSEPNASTERVKAAINTLPPKEIHYTFPYETYERFKSMM